MSEVKGDEGMVWHNLNSVQEVGL